MKYLLPITALAALVAFVIYRKRKERWIPLKGTTFGGITTNQGEYTLGRRRHEDFILLSGIMNDEVGY